MQRCVCVGCISKHIKICDEGLCTQMYLFHLFLDFSLCDYDFDDCHVDAMCIDREGGYDCQCNDGYTGNGTHCDGMLSMCTHIQKMK